MSSTALFVLAAGRGTRLLPATLFVPKPLFFAAPSKRIVSYALDSCTQSCLDTYLVVAKRHRDAFDTFLSRKKYCVRLLESSKHLESGGEVLSHVREIQKYKHIVVLPGDSYMNSMDVGSIISKMEQTRSDLCIIGSVSRKRGETLEIDSSGYVCGIRAHVVKTGKIVAAGIYVLRASIVDANPDLCGKSITTTALLRTLIRRGHKICLFVIPDRWRDLGTWSRYLRFVIFAVMKSLLYAN